MMEQTGEERNACWGRMAQRFLWGIALAVLFLVPVSALLGGGGAGEGDGPAFLVAWGGDGGAPAIALVDALPEAPEEAVVLLPGCASAAGVLRVTLRNDGVGCLSAFFLPTGSPYPRGGKALLKECDVRRIVVAEDPRSRSDWQNVIQEALESGTALERLQPEGDRQWNTEFGDWDFCYRRLPDGENEGVLSLGKDGCRFVFRNLETGEFVLERHEGEIVTALLNLPRKNRQGVIRVAMTN